VIITHIQFRTGQTEALLIIIIVREHLDNFSPFAPCSRPSDYRDLYTTSEKNKELNKTNHFHVNEARYRSPWGMELVNCHNSKESNSK